MRFPRDTRTEIEAYEFSDGAKERCGKTNAPFSAAFSVVCTELNGIADVSDKKVVADGYRCSRAVSEAIDAKHIARLPNAPRRWPIWVCFSSLRC